ncbi:MAG: retention module-containing protein, partial [Cycloclasticus sp.]|nr:retention module-containing protein [Cycloclasticus sp.]
MANVGTVKSVTGIVKAIAEDGSERILSVGDSVAENEKIITGDGVIVIAFSDGTVMDLGSNSSVVLNDDVLNQDGEQTAQSQSDAVDEVAALQQALANNPNLDPSALPATAAGAAASETAENNGHSIVSVDYLNPKIDPTSGFETKGINPVILSSEEELLLAIDEPLNAVAGEPEAAVVINGELGYFKEDTANDVTLSASTADSTDELTSLTLSGLT